MTKIAVIVGSLQKNSFNKKLARAIEERAPQGVEFTYVDINLPLFNQDVEAAEYPARATEMKQLVEASDGVLFVTPEYNRALPGVMKNTIDWLSRPWGTNSFAGKPAGIVGASPVSTGSAFAQGDLRRIAAFLEMKQLGQPEVYMVADGTTFDEDGKLTDERWSKNLTAYAEAFVKWVEENK